MCEGRLLKLKNVIMERLRGLASSSAILQLQLATAGCSWNRINNYGLQRQHLELVTAAVPVPVTVAATATAAARAEAAQT